jgi:predicted  nucleic acid-binding Zn-ribbon protein
MSEKELYQQKKQAQLDEWKAEVDKLKAKASGASADTQMELNKQIEALEGKIEEGQTKLAEIADASEDAWESIKDGVESAWDSMKSAFSDAAAKFKK